MVYKLASAGFIALLMKKNKETYRYSHIIPDHKVADGHFHVFFNENIQDRFLLVREEEYPDDYINQNCCSIFLVDKNGFDNFFKEDQELHKSIITNCSREPMGVGYMHCEFHKLAKEDNGGPYCLPYTEKQYKKNCTYIEVE